MTVEEGVFVEGFLHEIGVYDSDDEFGELILPFACDGMEAGEPVVFSYDPHKTALLQDWLPEHPGVTYVTDASPYATPGRAIVEWRKVVESRLASGAKRVRIAGNVPHPGYGQHYSGWDRYEAAVDRALGDLPVWSPCLYDARITPPDVLAIAKRRHRHMLESSGDRRVNESFAPVQHFGEFLAPAADPLEAATPALELSDATPAHVRGEIARLADGVLSYDARDQLLLAVSEIVTNALVHGKPPVRVRAWRDEDHLAVWVQDQGSGPHDPLAGLLKVDHERAGGRGLWIVHQLDVDIAFIDGQDGFTVRLTAR